jgi:hypothetical protein
MSPFRPKKMQHGFENFLSASDGKNSSSESGAFCPAATAASVATEPDVDVR